MRMDDFLNAGKNIQDDIQDAIRNNNYQDLSGKIRRQVDAAFHPAEPRSYFNVRKISRSGSVVKMAFGGIGTVFNAFGLLVGAVMLAASAAAGIGTIIFFLVFLLIFAGLLRSGRKEKDLIDTYYYYGERLGAAEYFDIAKFAELLGTAKEQVKAELLKMMHRGYLPQARLDRNQTTMMLTDRAYQMYRQAEESERQRRASGQAPYEGNGTSGGTGGAAAGMNGTNGSGTGGSTSAAANRAGSAAGPESMQDAAAEQNLDPEVRKTIETGRAYIRHVREVNDRIPDTEAMSDKLYKLEDITNRIFRRLREHPESLPEMRKFLNYYLPTTQKLMDAYVNLYDQPASGQNIEETKHEIEDAFDEVNQAFEKLLDDMYQDTAWDISSDISVMKTMMAQDGLTKPEQDH